MRWQNDRTQRVVISFSKSIWRSLASSVLQGSVLDSSLFSIFTNDLEEEIRYTLSKSTNDTKPGKMADTPEFCAAIQQDLDRLQGWAEGI